jgi:hypothetical protein
VDPAVRVCDVARDADAFVNSGTHSIDVIGSGENINFWADQLPGPVLPDDAELV